MKRDCPCRPGSQAPSPKEKVKYRSFLRSLSERERRFCVAHEAMRRGRGGLAQMCQVSGLSAPTILRGMHEISSFAQFKKEGQPILSVDAKKKELIGNFANPGRTWRRQRAEVNAHDFGQDASARAVPYGLYDVSKHRGHVRVGISGNTPRFAVNAIRQWCQTSRRKLYRSSHKLLILADAGGSNGCRPRAWKYMLQHHLATPLNLEVTVCHFPRGASKWNPVEHRLFGPISASWAGEPLSSLQKMMNMIRATTGVRATAELDRRKYPTRERVSDEQMASIQLRRHRICPTWNYTIKPYVNNSRPRATGS